MFYINAMMQDTSPQVHASLRELNQRLSTYMGRVERGETVIVTRRGQPIAYLRPYSAEKKLSAGQRRALVRTKARMSKGYALGGARFSREAAHER